MKLGSHVKPGGWAEFQDLDIKFYSDDNTLKDDSALSTWLRQSEEAVTMIGRTLSPGPHLKGWIEAAGFVNVRHEVFKLPVGLWPKQKSLVRSVLLFYGVVQPMLDPPDKTISPPIIRRTSAPSTGHK